MSRIENKDIHLNRVISVKQGYVYCIERPSRSEEIVKSATTIEWLRFQKGDVNDSYGITNEDLYKILIDRNELFADGELSTPETVRQLELLKECLELNDKRLQDRYDRGVIGTNEK